MQNPCHVKKTLCHNRHPGPLALEIFLTPFPWCSLSVRSRGCVIDASVGATHPTITDSLRFDQLFIFVIMYLLQKEVSVMRDEGYTYLWVQK